ncbi:MAG: sulfatase-like hydrolase/transferase, partial [Nitrospiraceae bacterium]|nr:sulfatase-like hydrolase/transferase [Nitrospiraceae bacterium]
MSRRRFCGLAAGALALASGGCARRGKALPDVVMVVLDTVRASNLKAWGYGRSTTPQLDGFLKTATQYARAYSTAPWTLPAHVSLFTGQYTFQHGVRGYREERADGTIRIFDPPLGDAAHTLAERLGEAGYATGAFTANTVFMKERYNLNQGFERYKVGRIRGKELVAEALEWTRRQRGPFFLFVNIMDAHRPYDLAPVPGVALKPVPQDETLLQQFYESTMPGTSPVDLDLAARVMRQYDSGIANGDHAFGRLLTGLKEAGRFDDSLVVLTSDHGEFLGEHGLVEHSKDIYQETVWVPLAVKMPMQRTGERHKPPVSLAQVPGSVLEAAGLLRSVEMAP